MSVQPTSKDFNTLHLTARKYAKAGIKIFPCWPRTKEPATPHGHLDASADLAQIDAWWTENPNYNLAMCPHDNGWTVVDEEAGTDPAWTAGRPLPETYTVSSPRGGTHKYYEGDGPSTVKRLGPTTDTRGVGGYVLLPPSIFYDEKTGKTGRYKVLKQIDITPLPPWIPAALAKSTEKAPSSAAGDPVSEEHLRELLSHIDPDAPRDDWRGIVAGIHATPLTGDEDGSKRLQIAIEFSRGDLYLFGSDARPSRYTGDDAVRQVFKTMPPKQGGVSYGTIFAAAKAAGYEGPPARKSMAERFAPYLATLNESAPTGDSGLIMRQLDKIDMKKIEWLWLNRIPRGKCSLVAGDPKLGKTTALIDIVARVSRGAPWPCREGTAPRGSVIYFSGEDDAADTLKPRMVAAGADPTKVHVVEAVKGEDGQGNRTFHLQADLARLEREIAGVGDVVLVIFDPISSYFGKTDTYRNTEVRGVLEPVVKMAARCDIAIIGNTHLAKGSKGRANMRVLDSVAMTAAVRSVYMVIADANEPKRRLFLPSGGNLGPEVGGLSFTIDAKVVEAKRGIIGSYVVWDKEAVTTTADEAFAAVDDRSKPDSAVDEATEFLRAELANGPVESNKVYWAARDNGHAERTLKRARARLGVIREKGKGTMSEQWFMRLP